MVTESDLECGEDCDPFAGCADGSLTCDGGPGGFK